MESEGAQVIVMASRALAAVARSADDYREVYDVVLGSLERPRSCTGWATCSTPRCTDTGAPPSDDLDEATEVLLEIVTAHADRVDGVKVSLLDADREVAIRRRLPEGVRLYTGDDFNYPALIAGDEQGHSDALLGIFDAIAPAAGGGAARARRAATGPRTTASSPRPCRWRGACSRRRPSTTRPASCSWPSSTATRSTSAWSAGRRARARSSISPTCSCSPTAPACCATRQLAIARMRQVLALAGIA